MIGKFLQEIIQARGSAKTEVLRRYKNDKNICDILEWCYNPDITYGIRCAPVSPINLFDRTEELHEDEYELLELLSTRELSGGAAELKLQRVVNKHGKLVQLIINRDLQAGVAATTINKAIPGLVPQFKVQLAKEVPLSEVKFPCWMQLKYDGVRIIAIINNFQTTLKTRNGKVVHMPQLKKVFDDAFVDDMVLDGELVHNTGNSAGKSAYRTSVSGIVNSAIHGNIPVETNLVFKVFDYLPYKEFITCTCSKRYSDRLEELRYVVKELKSPRVSVAETKTADSPEYVNSQAEMLYDIGYEGLILKSPQHKYSFKRSKDWVKIKQTKSVDLHVEGAVEGTGKYLGMVGALICTGTVEGKAIRVHVGSGLSDSQRDVTLDHYLGKVIEVHYNSIIQDSKTKEWSLFLPRFIAVRFDKD